MNLKVERLEGLFILGFGIFHFFIPFLLKPNSSATISFILTLHVSDFVLPGCFILAVSAIIFFLSKNLFLQIILVFLYSGGIFFHSLYLAGLFPSVISVQTPFISVAGIVVDGLSIATIYDYYRRIHGS